MSSFVSTRQKLIAFIDYYQSQGGRPDSTISRLCTSSPDTVQKIRAGREPTTRTLDDLYVFMHNDLHHRLRVKVA